MSLSQIYLISTIISLFLTILFFSLRRMEYNLRRSKYIISFLLLLMGTFYFLNLGLFDFSEEQNLVGNDLIIILSQFFLFSSFIIFIYAFFIGDQDVIELYKPSIYRSRKISIEIGKIMKKNRKKHKFFLSLKDLERHMFVCGATGSGKSNFVQYPLMNFKKRYDIPFLLVEFKGEYTFLQDVIEDMLIIRPRENFSLNIFDPEGANPEIHAERLFDILRSGQFLDEQSEFSPQMQRVLVDILQKSPML